MRKLVWTLAWISVAVWSLFAWGAYGLLDFFGNVAARNADIVTGHAETVEWLSWAFAAVRSLGLGAIVFVWAAISLVILAVAALIARVVSPARTVRSEDQWRGAPVGTRGADGYPPSLGAPPRQIDRR